MRTIRSGLAALAGIGLLAAVVAVAAQVAGAASLTSTQALITTASGRTMTAEVTSNDPPGAPTLDSAAAADAGIALSWTAPSSSGDGPIADYRVYRGTTPWFVSYLTDTGTDTSFTDSRVVKGLQYYYEVTAFNAYGEGPHSNQLAAIATATTLQTPGAPTLVSADATPSGTTLTWQAPNGGEPPTAYWVFRGTSPGNEELEAGVAQVDTYTDPTARNGVTYYYYVRGSNDAGYGDPSNELSAVGQVVMQPSAPTLVSAVAGDDGVTLTWQPPDDDGGAPITAYRIYRADLATPATVTGDVTTYTDTATRKGVTYSYQVAAYNGTWESPLSDVLSATATGPLPPRLFPDYDSTPVGSFPRAVAIGDVTGDGRNDVVMTTGFYFDPANDRHIFVFAQRPDGTLAPPVSYATAHSSNGPTSVAVGDISGDGRADVVVGVDGVGVQVFPQLPNGTLGAPTTTPSSDATKIRLGQLNGDGRLDVAGLGSGSNTVSVFLNDAKGGLTAPVSYAAQHGGFDDLEVGDVTTDGRDDLVVMSGEGLAPDLSVLPQLAAGGFGPASPYSILTSTGTAGIGVGDVTGDGHADVVASYGGNQPYAHIAVFSQTASGSLAAPVSYPSYDIPEPVDVADVDLDGRGDVVVLHGGPNAGVYLQQPGGTLGAEELFGIPSASHHDPHGLAVGDVNGDGTPDIAIASYPDGLVVLRNTSAPAGPPHAPSLTAATAAPGSVSLSWTPGSSAGGGASGYDVYRGTASGGETLLATLGTATSYTDATAANGTTYYYEVAARNPLGESARSDERSATPETVPGAPTLTAATPGNGRVDLAWSAPSSNGGTAIGHYEIYRGTASGAETLLAAVGNVTGYTDSSAANGSTYYYEVSAVNSVGEGPRSGERSATPDGTAPSKPAGLKLVAAGTNQLALDWAPSTDNVAVAGYRVYRNGTLVATGPQSQYLDAALAAATNYTYQVAAVDAAGNRSGLSNSLNAKTAAAGSGTTGTLAGAVYNSGGAPLANAVVTVTAGATRKTAKTSASGAWKIASLPPAGYTVTVALGGYRTQTLTVGAVAGKTVLSVASLAAA